LEAIDTGDFPKWTVSIPVTPEAEAEPYGKRKGIDPFDVTKVWSHKDFPLQEVGVMELNENPENYFGDIEQAAFSPANVVPGLSFSPDETLLAIRDAVAACGADDRADPPLRAPATPEAVLDAIDAVRA